MPKRRVLAADRPCLIELVLARLQQAKRDRVPFHLAWRAAARALPPVSSDDELVERIVLARTRGAWHRAYEDQPAMPGEVAAGLLVGALETAEPTPDVLVA